MPTFATDKKTPSGVSVFTNDGGILSVCVSETEGDTPSVLVGLQRHDRSMQTEISVVDAAALARAIDAMASRLLLLDE